MNNEEKILQMLEQMDNRQSKTEKLLEQMQGEMTKIKASMATKEDLTGLATTDDLNALQAEMRDGFEKVHGDIGRLYENSDKNMKLINEGLGHLNDRYAQLDKVEHTTENHGNRIFALEQLAANK